MKDLARTVAAALVAGVAIAAGWPARVNATFPWIELGRARPAGWEPVFWGALLGVVAIVRRRPFTGAIGAVHRLLGVLACAALIAWVFTPVKVDLNLLVPPTPGMATIPVLGGSPQVWTRATLAGNGVTLLPAEVRDAWTLMDVAGGIGEQLGQPSVVRTALWIALKGVTAFALVARIAVMPLLLWIVGGLVLNRAAGRVESGVLRAMIYAVPVANLAALAVCTVTMLPDDVGLRGRACLTAAGWLAVVAVVDRVGTWRS